MLSLSIFGSSFIGVDLFSGTGTGVDAGFVAGFDTGFDAGFVTGVDTGVGTVGAHIASKGATGFLLPFTTKKMIRPMTTRSSATSMIKSKSV